MSDVSAIQGWVTEVSSTMSGLGQAIEQAAPTGDFASVFQSAQSVLDAFPGASAASSSNPAAAAAGTPSTSSLLTGAGSTSTTTGTAVVATAEKYLGVPYLWGGTTPSGFDCSGFVQYVYGQLGVSLPRTSEEQALVGTPVASVADAQPGDLVFYPGSDGTAASPGHVGIYIGNGEMINAPQTGSVVSITAVGDPTAIRRILPGDPSASAATPTEDAAGSLTTLATAAADTTGVGASPNGAPPSLAVPSAYASLFDAAAAKYGVPSNLLAAMAQVESNYNPTAMSAAGAEGMMQLMPSVASGLGVNPYDPAQAIDGAAQLMASYLAQYHSTAEALAAYNAGPNAVAANGGVPPYGETQSYVSEVTALAGLTTSSVAN